jgi:hypothetical protein
VCVFLCVFCVGLSYLGFVVMRVGFFIPVSRFVVLIGGIHLFRGQYGFCMVIETSSLVLCCFLGVRVRDSSEI